MPAEPSTQSTRIPIIRLYGTLIVSIQIALSDRIVAQLKDDVTASIERTMSRALVVDVSGIDLMDSYISRALRDLALIARLMGVTTVLSGLSPSIAMTLVEMDLDLRDVRTVLGLEDALAWLASRGLTSQTTEHEVLR